MATRPPFHQPRHEENVSLALVIVMFGLAVLFGISNTALHLVSPGRIPVALWIFLVFVVGMSFIGMLLCAVLFYLRIVWPQRFRGR